MSANAAFSSLMKFINSNISVEISKPALYGASFVPTWKLT